MADVPSTRPDDGASSPKVDGFQGGSFEKDEHMYSLIKTQRKRSVNRPLYSSLSMVDDISSRHKKRNRKADKRYVVEKLDGFTFVSAFTLNDFDEYDQSLAVTKSSTPPPGKLKRKSTTTIEPAVSKKPKSDAFTIPENVVTTVNNVHAFPEKSYTSLLNKGERYTTSSKTPKAKLVPSTFDLTAKTKKRARNHVCSIPGNFEASVAERDKSNLTLNKNSVLNENTSNKSLPLTKTALVRLKKINVGHLSESKDSPKNIRASNANGGHIQMAKHGQKHGSARRAGKPSTAPHMHKPKHGKAASLKNPTGANPIVITDGEDNVELDVCSIDDSSSSANFILKNLKPPEEYSGTSRGSKPKCEEKHKRKRKPCPTCASNPSHIVGAKRIKSNEYRFPRFDVSYSSRCLVHPPGEISVLAKSSSDSTDVNIQTTPMDIKMHVEFAKRFPYQAISIASCQPSLENEMGIPTTRRCSANHRFLEQQRREELHGLYCKLAETIAIPKHRASKIWILENARKEIKTLEDDEKLHLAAFEREKEKNEKLRKRWEELSGKPYVPPKEDNGVLERKSKLLELYDKYKEESRGKLQVNLTSSKNKLEQQKVRKEESNSRPTAVSSNSVLTPSRNVSRRKLSTPCKRLSSFGSRQSMSANHDKAIKRATEPEIVAPRSVVRPFKPVSSESPSIPDIPTVNVTPIKPKLINLPARSVTPVTVADCIMTQAACSTHFRSSPTQSSAQRAATSRSNSAPPDQNKDSITTSQPNGSKPAPVIAASNEFVIVSMVVKGRTMVFRIPKTVEGLTMLNRLSLMKKLNAETVAKIVSQFSALTPPEQSPVLKPTTVPASHLAITVTPTQWSGAASSSEIVIQQSLKQPIPASTIKSPPQTAQILDASQDLNARSNIDATKLQNKLIFLNKRAKPNPKAFRVIPTSSTINVTLNNAGSITVNKLFNKKQTNPIPQVNLASPSFRPTFSRLSSSTNVSRTTFISSSAPAPSANVHQIQTSTTFSGLSSANISTTTIPRPSPTINIPSTSLLSSSPIPTARISSANVHPYALPLQTPLSIPVSQIGAVPPISDSLMEDTSQHHDNMQDNGMCVISNVFSLTDTAGISKTENSRANDSPRM